MKLLTNLYPNRHLGLLFLRIGIGIMFMIHGYPKLMGGPEKWELVGSAMSSLGITSGAQFWGLVAALAEFAGGFLLILGLFFRPVNLFLFITMMVAALMHISKGDGFNDYSHSMEAGILFLSLFFIGPGLYSLDQKLFPGERL